MIDRTWHNLGGGSWWRTHANGVDAWHALAGFDDWELRLIARAAGWATVPGTDHQDAS